MPLINRPAASSLVVLLAAAPALAAQSTSPSFRPPSGSIASEAVVHLEVGGATPIAELTLVPQRTRWALDVQVGGQPFRFGLDIGGGLTLLSTRAASAAGCTPWGRITGFQMTGRRLDAARCDSVTIDAGALHVTPSMSLVLPPEAVESGDANLDGSIALDAFE